MRIQATPLIDGAASGPVLALSEPLSFWGGVDPQTGRITQPRHPEHGRSIAGTVLVLPATIGSSSSSAILLELIAAGKAPAAIVLPAPDAILAVGVVVAREMGHAALPVFQCDIAPFAGASRATLHEGGAVTLTQQ